MTQPRVLVTGSSGFLGSAFCEAAIKAGIEIIAFSGVKTGSTRHGKELEITVADNVRGVLREVKPTHIFNFASRGVTRDNSTLEQLLAVNTVGALNIVEGLVSEGLTPKTFMFGTAYEYANSIERIPEHHPLDPLSGYAISKTCLFYALKEFSSAGSLTFLRLFNVYGPHEPTERLIPFIVAKAKANELIQLTKGEQLRDFMFLDDLIAILLALGTKNSIAVGGLRTLNIGTGSGTMLREFVQLVAAKLTDYDLDPRLEFGAIPYRAQDPMSCVCDNRALLREIGGFSFTDLAEGVAKTVESFYEE